MTRDEEKNAVRLLCEAIGYGNTMHLASELWSKKDKFGELGAFAVGPCLSMIEKCPHLENGIDTNGHCDWCCGSGWVTRKVLAAMAQS